MIRNPAVSGMFYPAGPRDLNTSIEKYIERDAQKDDVIGVMAPHAGYVYSGAVAAATYSRANLKGIDTFVILGPNHTGLGKASSIMLDGQWIMPFGDVLIDSILGKEILVHSKYLKSDFGAHLREHSIEVQIPFLQYFNKDFQLVPVVMADARLEVCRDIGKAIARGIKKTRERVMVIASSDLTHYEPQQAANEKDRIALDDVLRLDEEKLLEDVWKLNISMCGCAPTAAMIAASKELGAKEAELVKYMTSGDVSGDYGRVVGYGGVLIK
ncbi:MAG: AmmeMemoRadiSam system protein B [Candidatus Altiarchaeales archaeon WOR_SM1_86-2]|nr:MAG: AmmeMemoRadiSam system protein B [Candidatus Altiarchaeales archaeon WOR_SM1_86-2]